MITLHVKKCYLSECSGCNKCKFNCDNKYEKIVGEEDGKTKIIKKNITVK